MIILYFCIIYYYYIFSYLQLLVLCTEKHVQIHAHVQSFAHAHVQSYVNS